MGDKFLMVYTRVGIKMRRKDVCLTQSEHSLASCCLYSPLVRLWAGVLHSTPLSPTDNNPACVLYCVTPLILLQNWYCASKTEAEFEAFEYAKRSGLDVVSVCPTLILGPMMHSNVNSSSLVLIKLLKEGYESIENKMRMIVDVRDVAAALLLAYEKPEAEGRYICTAHHVRVRELVDKLKQLYPSYNYPKSITEVEDEMNISSDKLQKLGWSYKPLEETLTDAVESYKKLGLVD
ncbi:hypothetical protein RND81_03G023800 [Saponaria officinalis]|uniref:NAD-dependent epimerase/dehydratase domain-containing protein n=1 Tax=Saponaria officinalis TaxID=3572 RepID=A0AAW1M378_SAPOF